LGLLQASVYRERSRPQCQQISRAFEHIVTNANETFLWRADDYPWERNAWNYHPEIEIHFSGIAVLFR